MCRRPRRRPRDGFTDTFDRPNSPVLGNGWSVLAGSLMLQAGEARNQSTSTFSLAVQPGLVGATQTVAASFASTNNNTGPRFGVVVRYQNPQNYYICYRQVGGSSVLRIAKVQNGVETVLKSVGIGNPALNAFSTLSCQASGSTLTLLIDGVTKRSTIDGTFSTGRVGYTISTQRRNSTGPTTSARSSSSQPTSSSSRLRTSRARASPNRDSRVFRGASRMAEPPARNIAGSFGARSGKVRAAPYFPSLSDMSYARISSSLRAFQATRLLAP